MQCIQHGSCYMCRPLAAAHKGDGEVRTAPLAAVDRSKQRQAVSHIVQASALTRPRTCRTRASTMKVVITRWMPADEAPNYAPPSRPLRKTVQ